MEKYGFVYIWYDVWRKMFYIGCHWGTIDDGYICSSNRMRDAYRRRPQDFKRRILKTNISKENLLDEEQVWLQMIKPNELKVKYYNIKKDKINNWYFSTKSNRKRTIERITLNHASKQPGYVSPNKGIKLSTERVEHIRQNSLRMWRERSQEQRDNIGAKISRANKGKNVSEETRTKLAEKAKKQFSTPEARQAVSERNKKNGNIPPSQKGMLWWNNGTEHKQSKNCPGVDWVRGRLSWYSDEAKKKMSESAKKRVRNGRSSNPIIL